MDTNVYSRSISIYIIECAPDSIFSHLIQETVMSIYSDKLAHVHVVINYPYYSVAHLCTSEATLAYNLGALHFDDVMSYNSLTTVCIGNL